MNRLPLLGLFILGFAFGPLAQAGVYEREVPDPGSNAQNWRRIRMVPIDPDSNSAEPLRAQVTLIEMKDGASRTTTMGELWVNPKSKAKEVSTDRNTHFQWNLSNLDAKLTHFLHELLQEPTLFVTLFSQEGFHFVDAVHLTETELTLLEKGPPSKTLLDFLAHLKTLSKKSKWIGFFVEHEDSIFYSATILFGFIWANARSVNENLYTDSHFKTEGVVSLLKIVSLAFGVPIAAFVNEILNYRGRVHQRKNSISFYYLQVPSFWAGILLSYGLTEATLGIAQICQAMLGGGR